MGRQVRLRDINEMGNSDAAYHAPNGKYYSTQSAYETIHKQQEYRAKCVDLLYEILGYDAELPAPTSLYKLLDQMKKCGYDVIYETIERMEETIYWAIEHKEFRSEYGKIAYIMTVVRNNVIDVYKEHKSQEASERGSSNIINIDDYITRKQSTKDIRKWIDE